MHLWFFFFFGSSKHLWFKSIVHCAIIRYTQMGLQRVIVLISCEYSANVYKCIEPPQYKNQISQHRLLNSIQFHVTLNWIKIQPLRSHATSFKCVIVGNWMMSENMKNRTNIKVYVVRSDGLRPQYESLGV